MEVTRVFKLSHVTLAVSLLNAGKQSHVHVAGAEQIEGTKADGEPVVYAGAAADAQIKDPEIVADARALLEKVGRYMADANQVGVRGAAQDRLIQPTATAE